ncbi:hypothetical protein RHMOL_Rhmol01G0321000 [Rhododendron molle]|uniref:Uncharacterized protein n=1 Tax=Rhododendron molle TaxID=49168 RepID=A0ACC0Q8F2_RHOML|nr:hypothetical protein RHMOL_Rhmol01G0321000 [Rhododendron molle]
MESTADEALPNRYRRRTGPGPTVGGDKELGKERSKDDDDDCDKEVWDTLSGCFRRVQSVLDHNRVLIQQVNENHQSKTPDNLAKNVALIQEINGNISKVMSMYSDMSVNFSGIVQQRRAIGDSKSGSSSDGDDKGKSEGS